MKRYPIPVHSELVILCCLVINHNAPEGQGVGGIITLMETLLY